MKLALYQGPPIQGDIEEGFARIEAQLGAAALSGARMAVFPELFLPGYNQPGLHASLSQPLGGAWCDRLGQLAETARCGLTIGWAERDGDQVYNAATAFGPDGAILGHYRKIQLFGPMEQQSFAFGNGYTLFDYQGHKTALMICYDVEFAHHVKALADQGVTLILVPTANPAGFEHVSTAIVPSRASEHVLTIAYANFCGSENGLGFGGHSVIVGPDARALAAASTTETLLVTDIAKTYDPALLSTQSTDYREVTP
ncbi:carbon-nitrogen hydrolase family protein [Marimonas arenosa]|uniref:Carbon-nitrogen hydrolase family protein n=1 Tax=Marimonas arenosa TaxID=1795305 RepID=A0AAE4B5Z5_9RHOB|nr:carbon-nitrogen hydrolase family protein [Marimonas arenosa]MDQ2090814.1 carbon-nitrogen hydrolase family protein [Marimonas arenosa]